MDWAGTVTLCPRHYEKSSTVVNRCTRSADAEKVLKLTLVRVMLATDGTKAHM